MKNDIKLDCYIPYNTCKVREENLTKGIITTEIIKGFPCYVAIREVEQIMWLAFPGYVKKYFPAFKRKYAANNKNIYKEYFEQLLLDYTKETLPSNRISESEFAHSTIEKEKKAIEQVKKYINLFKTTKDEQERFIKYCYSFFEYLNKLEYRLKNANNENQNLASNKRNNKQPQPEIKSFSDMFTVTGWNKYLDALTECTPKLLKKENDNYTFIGNQKTQRGCIAQWFKYLKAKGIIYQTLNRQEIAKVLSNEIVNFSIVGSSIDNETEFYKTTIHKQLEQYTNNII